MIFYFARISKDVFIHPVPVQVIIRITFILFLPFISNKTRFQFFSFVQIEVSINISSELQIFVEFDFKELEENNKKLKQLEAEYASIRERLEIACQMGDLTEYPKVAILNMSHKVIEHLAVKYKNVAKGVSRTMGGKVLNYEAKDILNRGRMEEKFQLAAKLLKSGSSVEYVAELTELPQEAVLELAQTLQSEQ